MTRRIIYMTTGTCRLGLDRLVVAMFRDHWYWLDIGLWRRLEKRPEIDLDFTQRSFGYTSETMARAREELLHG